MIKRSLTRYAVAVLTAGLALAVSVPGQAMAASKFANKDKFDTAKLCDAVVGVSDETTTGKIEVFGGFSCKTGFGLANFPEKTTIRVRLFKNGQELLQSKKAVKNCFRFDGVAHSCSSESHQVAFPDDSTSDRYWGKMEIVSFTGRVTLTTKAISS